MTLEELKDELEQYRNSFDAVYLHWSAGDYDSLFSDYHLCIDGSGGLHYTLDFGLQSSATWHRNFRSLSICLCCGRGAELFRDGSTKWGNFPPTDEQIECLAQVITTISNVLHLPIRQGLFMTHGEAAELDGYGASTTCERWDLWTLPQSPEWGSGGNFIRGKALFYQKEWANE